jgi:putative endopeptidase
VDKTEWGMTPQTVNAYYNPLQNEIVFPAAILQPPFFDAKADDAINYGGIGAVIGHEMSHGYDDQGSRSGRPATSRTGGPGRRKGFAERTASWWPSSTATPPPGKVNGKLTLGENIADLGGLATAYDAMKAATAGKPDPMIDGLSRDQRFFLNWATVWRRNFTPENLAVRLKTDPHAPAEFRAIGAPSNLPAFAAAFQCKAGDAMVRPATRRWSSGDGRASARPRLTRDDRRPRAAVVAVSSPPFPYSRSTPSSRRTAGHAGAAG